MRLFFLLPLALGACATIPTSQLTPQDRAERWSAHVAALSSDAMEGRAAGTPGHERAAAYVVEELRRLGLQPAAGDGFLQRIDFTEQRIDYAASTASLTVGNSTTPVALPASATVSPRRPLPPELNAPLVFVGYGLHMPDAGHDDFAGVDLNGKIAVFLSGGPTAVPGSMKAHARAQRSQFLAARGAAGSIAISTPDQAEASWQVVVRNAGQPGFFFADQSVGGDTRPFVEMTWNPAEAERLFSGSGRTFAALAALADASRPLPSFDMNARLQVRASGTTRAISSPNVAARLSGSDSTLAGEHVVMTAHLDGLGVGQPVNGDAINNGALDNAAGVAALLDMAQQLKARWPRRSILFVFVTAEERGLLGARYFARRPTVPRESIVANLNYDMALPLYPLRSVTVLGAEESSIGAVAQEVGAAMGLPLAPDPFPDRNSFIRSDQYAFIEQGIPAAAFKFGFAAGTPDAETERAFRATRYHQPSDDMTATIFPVDEIRLHDFIAEIALRIANADARPAWNQASIFGRIGR